MKRNRIYWNRGWQFTQTYSDEILKKEPENIEFETVTLPHTTKIIPYNYFDEAIYQMECGYRRCFNARPEWRDKKVRMTIEAAGHSAKVYLNGTLLGEHHCGYTAFCVDLTDTLSFDDENILVIYVDSRESQNIPPFGNVIDYMTFGGLYREVYIDITENSFLEDVFIFSQDNLSEQPKLISEITINSNGKHITLSEKTLRSGMVKLNEERLSFSQNIIYKNK